MAENVSGEIKLRMITEGAEGGEGVEGGVKAQGKPKEDKQLSGMDKWLGKIGKVMTKVSPVADLTGLIVYLIKKSVVLWTFIEAFLDIAGAYVDVILAAFAPILVPALQLLAAFIPVVQSIMKLLEPIIKDIASKLATAVGWIKIAVDWIKKIIDKIPNIGKIPGVKQAGQALNKAGEIKNDWFTLEGLARKGIGGFRSLTGLASGTSYVPSNMTAELHRGESVLNARETQRRGTSQGMNIMNPQFVVNAGGSTTLDAKAFAQQLYQEFSKKLVTEARRV